MSKITPKNLSYDSSLPPFLARLQSAPQERNEFQAARPKKPRTVEDEADDEPVYFDEGSGETLTKKQWEERENVAELAEAGETVEGEDKKEGESGKGEPKEGKEKVAAIGVSKKRKVGKVVGGDEEDGDTNAASKEPKKTSKPEGDSNKTDAGKSKSKTAKKGKKIKLSFGDED